MGKKKEVPSGRNGRVCAIRRGGRPPLWFKNRSNAMPGALGRANQAPMAARSSVCARRHHPEVPTGRGARGGSTRFHLESGAIKDRARPFRGSSNWG